jgi:uncharacterized membrane protein
MTMLVVAGTAIAAYLLTVRLLGGAPACGPIHGCDTVAASPYATVLGLPVALFGVAYSLVLAAAAIAWWRQGARRALLALYGLGLLGVVAVGYLTYLELFVIGAICVWCVSYAIAIVVVWVLTVIALRSTEAEAE